MLLQAGFLPPILSVFWLLTFLLLTSFVPSLCEKRWKKKTSKAGARTRAARLRLSLGDNVSKTTYTGVKPRHCECHFCTSLHAIATTVPNMERITSAGSLLKIELKRAIIPRQVGDAKAVEAAWGGSGASIYADAEERRSEGGKKAEGKK